MPANPTPPPIRHVLGERCHDAWINCPADMPNDERWRIVADEAADFLEDTGWVYVGPDTNPEGTTPS